MDGSSLLFVRTEGLFLSIGQRFLKFPLGNKFRICASPCGRGLDTPKHLRNNIIWKQNSKYVECDNVVIHQSLLGIYHFGSISLSRYRLQQRLNATLPPEQLFLNRSSK
jgi:hypothetical protein